MASTEEEYHELMNAEVFVEIDKLRDIAKHGVPDTVRGEVWMYLLGVQLSDKCKTFSSNTLTLNGHWDPLAVSFVLLFFLLHFCSSFFHSFFRCETLKRLL